MERSIRLTSIVQPSKHTATLENGVHIRVLDLISWHISLGRALLRKRVVFAKIVTFSEENLIEDLESTPLIF